MNTKKFITIILSLMLMFALTACGNKETDVPTQPTDSSAQSTDSSTQPADSSAQSSDNSTPAAAAVDLVAGEIADSGNIRALCPEGWFHIPIRNWASDDPDATEPNSLLLQKGSDVSYDRVPHIAAVFFGNGYTSMSLEDQKKYYDTAVDLAPFTIGSDTWEGFTYSLGESHVEATIKKQGVDAFYVTITLEMDDETLSFTDPDVQTILSSIEY